jgi:hypothetical protein
MISNLKSEIPRAGSMKEVRIGRARQFRGRVEKSLDHAGGGG